MGKQQSKKHFVPIKRRELLAWLTDKGKKHDCYKYYSKTEYIQAILDDHRVILSDGRNWNDVKDRKRFMDTSDGYKKFGLCLSFSRSENVAMWMLYARSGCMINYPNSVVEEIWNAKSVAIGKFQNNTFVATRNLKPDDFQITVTDVIYYGESDSEKDYYVRRSSDVNRSYKRQIVDKLTYQKKEMPWMYENECRIVLSVKENLLSEEEQFAAISFSEKEAAKLKGRVFRSPNSGDSGGKMFQPGELAGKIEWDVCSGCELRQREKKLQEAAV